MSSTNNSLYSGVPDYRSIIDKNNLSYLEFRKTLSPKYLIIFRDTFFILLMIAIPFFFSKKFYSSNIFYILFSSVWIGFWLHSYKLFFHEVAHFNISPIRKINDLLGYILFFPFVGIALKQYRTSHWMHHKHLGTIADTEISYYKPITINSLFEGISGIYLYKSFLRYFSRFNEKKVKDSLPRVNNFLLNLGIMLFFQFFLVIILYSCLSKYVAFSYILAFFLIEPFFSGLRQTLEHRSFDAKNNIDYKSNNHGPINRLFNHNIFSIYFGSAGFNSHLIHHFDPFISYTRFRDIELYLLNSDYEYFIRNNKTSYFSAFRKLFKAR